MDSIPSPLMMNVKNIVNVEKLLLLAWNILASIPRFMNYDDDKRRSSGGCCQGACNSMGECRVKDQMGAATAERGMEKLAAAHTPF